MRKRPRSMNLKEASTDSDDESEGGSDSGMDEIVGKSASTAGRARAKGKGKAKARADDGDKMDIDESASVAGSVRSRGRAPKSKTQTQTPAKRRVRVTESKVVPGTDGEDDEVTSVRSAPVAPAKRRGRPPKSKAEITDSDLEMAVDGTPSGSKGAAATLKERMKARPRSLSRTRPGEASDASVGLKPKSRAKKVKEANARDLKADAEGADGDDEKPKKRRKVANT